MAKEIIFDPYAYGRPLVRKLKTLIPTTEVQPQNTATSVEQGTQSEQEENLALPSQPPEKDTSDQQSQIISQRDTRQEQGIPASDIVKSQLPALYGTDPSPQPIQIHANSQRSNGCSRTSGTRSPLGDNSFSTTPRLNVQQSQGLTPNLHCSNQRPCEGDIGTSDSSRNKMPTARATNGTMDSGDQLQQLQRMELQKIERKMAADRKRGKDKYSTTSLKDLDLARQPVDPARPSESRRIWAEDSPLTFYNPIEADVKLSTELDIDSTVTQAQTPPTSELPASFIGRHPSISLERSKWAEKGEMKADKEDLNSNAWGSAAPSDATHDTNISDEYFGKLLNRHPEEADKMSLVDWEGKMVAPAADWNERPRYNNNNSEFKTRFRKWLLLGHKDPRKGTQFNNGVPYVIILPRVLQDLNNHADGIAMSQQTTTITENNAAHFGYTKDPGDALQYSQPVRPRDFDDLTKTTSRNNDNFEYRNETTESLVSNWLKHLQNARIASMEAGMRIGDGENPTSNEGKPYCSAIERYIPSLNIYLRPATKADLSELTRIYNWYITEGAGPVETSLIGETEMQDRMRICDEGHFPFLVASKKKQTEAREMPTVNDEDFSGRKNLPVNHKNRITLTRVEQLVGFCCIQDLTAPDYVEHISAELEIYVDPSCKKMGVGTCLMDKMLEICDSGHRMSTDCQFHCDQKFRHLYGPGGNRDLHKIFILLRKWHHPRPAALSIQEGRRHRKLPYARKTENDYDRWLKSWLESWGFEEEGFLKKIGARHGRYLDLIYFGRETAWQPAEGNLPDPDPRYHISAQDLQDDADEEDYAA